VRLEALNELRKQGRAIKKDFERTTRTWDGDKPEFLMLISLTNGGPTLVIEPNGPGSDKWGWLNEGTDVRYATMTPDFQAKTSPRVIDSRRGRGGLLFVNKNRPRPGIKARQWTQVIARKWKRPFKKAMEGAMIRGVKKTGHYIKR
jgi:hypothetical protein